MKEIKMKPKLRIMTSLNFALIALAIASFYLLGSGLHAAPASKSDAASAHASGQKQFDTPKQAADALVQVASNFDVAAAKEILGPDSEDIVASEDPVHDKNRAAEFAAKAKEKMSVQTDKKDANQAVVVVGSDAFHDTIPLGKQVEKWFVETKAGRELILHRAVGGNELNVPEICSWFDEAQT